MPQIINTRAYLKGVTVAPNTGTPAGGNYSPPTGTGSSVSNEELQRAKLRIQLTRYLDDGLQTLGKMTIFEEDSTANTLGTVKFEMTTVELPYRGNANGISCIPPGKYLVRSYKSDHYKNCFWVYANEAGNWAKNALFGNGYKRSAVLIHRAPNSGWLMGCIGPGLKYNTDVTGRQINKKKYDPNHLSGNQKGNPYGTGQQDFRGMNKLINSGLWQGGDVTLSSFYMEIVNNPTGLISEPNSANRIMNLKTGEPIVFMGENTSNVGLQTF